MTETAPGVYEKEFACNYPGNCEDVVGQTVGPNTMGEYFKAVSATYDFQSHKTRVVFDLTTEPRGDGVQWWDKDTRPMSDRAGVQL